MTHMTKAERRPPCGAAVPGSRRKERRIQVGQHVADDASAGPHVYSASSSSSSSGSSKLARRRCRPRRSSFVTVVAFGSVLVGVAAVSSGSRNPPPPPPPPASLGSQYNNGRQQQQQQQQEQQQQQQQDRWAGWTPPPPGPPPDPVGGGGGEDAGMSWGAAPPGSSQGAATGQQGGDGDGTVCEDGSTQYSRENGPAVGMMGRSHQQQQRQQQQQQQQQQGVGAAGGGAREVHQQGHERMMMMGQQPGRGGPLSPPSSMQQYPQQQEHERQQQQQGQTAAWGQNGGQQHQQTQEQLYDRARNNNNIAAGNNGNNGHAMPPQSPPSAMFQQRQVEAAAAGNGMAGGAGSTARLGGGGGGGGSGGQWEPPSAASAGAVTPKVKLSQYRSAGGGGGGGELGGDQEQDNIARALLSNTDKEVIFDGLKKLYRKKILPLEESSRYAHFHSPPMNPADFEAKPMVLIVGQYSVGKTSFIRSLLKRDFPGQRVGPEPTTDRFVAVTHGEDERVMPGHALAMQADKPFRSLQQFGNNFLTKFEGSVVDAPILRNITLVDTPGVLSGEKQRIGRDYDFASVISWFAERADLIVIMFDAHKLDISDELKMVIDTLKPHHDKMRVLLNKADTIDTQQLMRVYGALMWSLGKVMQTPEVCRVYIGSFWEAPLSNFDNRFLLEKEKNDLLEELMLLPENAVVRRINELVKRARSVKVHAYIIHYLRKQMPYMMGKQEKQEKLIRRLDQEFLACARRYGLPLGDFPKVEKFRRSLREIKDISKFKSLDKSLVHEMDKVFSGDIPKLMEKAARPGNR